MVSLLEKKEGCGFGLGGIESTFCAKTIEEIKRNKLNKNNLFMLKMNKITTRQTLFLNFCLCSISATGYCGFRLISLYCIPLKNFLA